MRPVAPFDRGRTDRPANALHHHDAQAGRPVADDGGAPVSALTPELSFWDHLGATRAEEYAREDILSDGVIPVPPSPPVDSVSRDALLVALPEQGHASLDDTLRAEYVAAQATKMSGHPVDGIGLRTDIALPEGLPFASLPDPAWQGDAEGQPARKNWRSTSYGHTTRVQPGRKVRAPSRLSYRLQRLWLTPLYRRAIMQGLPVLLVVAAVAGFLASEARREMAIAQYLSLYAMIVDRPEFMVTSLQMPEMAPELDYAIRSLLEPELPLSSWRLDLDALRARIEALDAIRVADLRIGAENVLSVGVTERVPAIFWRSDEGLEVLDVEGTRIGLAPARHVRPDLPLIAGEGAPSHVAEALDLFEAASPLGNRVLGLVRIGARRWDVVLDREQRIKLPENGAVTALERVIALEQAQGLLARDIRVADLRNPSRPTLQLNDGALETFLAIRAQNMEAVQ